MILLGSLLHRQELAEIFGRAIENRMLPSDASRLKFLLNMNSYAMRVWSTAFATEVMKAIRGDEIQVVPMATKGQLKDLLVSNPHYLTPRIEELVNRYRRFPQDFYRETPFEGLVFVHNDPPRYAGSCRIKRIRRVAEKCARRLIDYIFEQVRQKADELAEQRAKALSIPKESLITPPEEMAAEFLHAERRVLKSIRSGLFVAAMPQFYIDDVVGIRIVVSPENESKVKEYLLSHKDLSLVDERVFSGSFVGHNMVFAYKLNSETLLKLSPDDRALSVLQARCVTKDPEECQNRYREFVLQGEGHVRFEVLLMNFEELIESEIGRSMHEEHILEQREKQEYRGRLARNVEALMLFLFAFAQSPKPDLEKLPIVIDGSYLDDYFDMAYRSLFMPQPYTLGLTM
jgi:hypothetical protein